ncbi:MAG: hypothetical protein WCO69_03195 [Candidatus Omnitrophota bacterium]
MIPLAHLPTLFLLIGYPLYWLELYAWPHPTGHTTWLATGVFVAVALFLARRVKIAFIMPELPRWFFFPAVGLVLGMIVVAFFAGLLPLHLPQEYDVINYHLTLPRQHLIAGSFAHLPWSSADLFLLPVDFALAPFWLATALPNKWPQFLFILGAAAVMFRLTMRFSSENRAASVLAVVALFSLHAFGIQAGTGMLDIALGYLFFAAIDSLLSGKSVLAALEFAFFFWSKPLIPAFMIAALAITLVLFLLLRRNRGMSALPILSIRQVAVAFLVSSVFVAGPFIMKSVNVAGTAFFPLTGAVMKPAACSADSIAGLSVTDQSACRFMQVKDSYGHGRSFGAFISHFWLVAVPEKGVNNSFDYPLGLTYLLYLVPFLGICAKDLVDRKLSFLAIFIVVYWLLWFTGTQQSRFLLVPLMGMIILVSARMARPSRVFLACVLLALMMTGASVARAHKPDLGRRGYDVLRPQDQQFLKRGLVVTPGEVVAVRTPDAAFAPFLVDVRGFGNEFVLDH